MNMSVKEMFAKLNPEQQGEFRQRWEKMQSHQESMPELDILEFLDIVEDLQKATSAGGFRETQGVAKKATLRVTEKQACPHEQLNNPKNI